MADEELWRKAVIEDFKMLMNRQSATERTVILLYVLYCVLLALLVLR